MAVLGSGEISPFAYKVMIFALVLTFLIPAGINVLCPQQDINETGLEFLDRYGEFTGSTPTSNTQLWALTGIYTPFGVDENGQQSTVYGTTEDGWIYGGRLPSYSPSQYDGTQEDYTVQYDPDTKLYKYSSKPSGSASINVGDYFTSVTMEIAQKSSIFFTTQNKHDYTNGFTYDYTGYRYSFQPISSYTGENANGDQIPIVASSSSLSLIWYQFNQQNNSGIAGQLIISGSDNSVSYVNSTQIVQSFNGTTSTSTIPMTFNGVQMNLVFRLNPYYISLGYSVEECYNLGLWEIMVYGTSVDSNSYINAADYSFNVWEIFETLVDLLTFNTDKYGLTGVTGTFASLAVTVPLYAMLVAIGVGFYPVLIAAGALAVFQAAQSFDILGWLGL